MLEPGGTILLNVLPVKVRLPNVCVPLAKALENESPVKTTSACASVPAVRITAKTFTKFSLSTCIYPFASHLTLNLQFVVLFISYLILAG
jgi:hypothetical protein